MDATTELSTADVLRRAKQVLIDRGWTNEGRNEAADGCVCAEGALLIAAGKSVLDIGPEAGRPYVLLKKAMGRAPCLFNDKQESVEPVLAAFNRAIALAESEAS